MPCSPPVGAHVLPWGMITNQRPPRGGATYENVPPRGGARPPRGGILLSTINNQFPTSWTARPHEEDASALASWAGEADGGMQRDAGVIGRRMTAAENAIDSAVLELAYDRHRVGRDAGTAAGAAVSGQWPRAAGARPWSQLVVVAWAVGAVWIQRGAVEGRERPRASSSMDHLHVDACLCLCAVLCVPCTLPIALAAAEPKLVRSYPAVHVRVNCSGVLIES